MLRFLRARICKNLKSSQKSLWPFEGMTFFCTYRETHDSSDNSATSRMSVTVLITLHIFLFIMNILHVLLRLCMPSSIFRNRHLTAGLSSTKTILYDILRQTRKRLIYLQMHHHHQRYLQEESLLERNRRRETAINPDLLADH